MVNPVPKPNYKKQGRAVKCPPVKKECYITKATEGLHKHHIFGGPNRKLSELYGLYVYLIPKYHTGDKGVHFNREFDLQLKREGQMKFEAIHGSREDFIRIFGKNYLEG